MGLFAGNFVLVDGVPAITRGFEDHTSSFIKLKPGERVWGVQMITPKGLEARVKSVWKNDLPADEVRKHLRPGPGSPLLCVVPCDSVRLRVARLLLDDAKVAVDAKTDPELPIEYLWVSEGDYDRSRNVLASYAFGPWIF